MTEPLIRCVACGTTRQQDEPPCTCLVRTPQPWQPGTVPTAAQLLAWVRVATDDEVLPLLDGLLRSSEVAHRCIVSDHDHGMRELTAAQADATRWRILRDQHRTIPDTDPQPYLALAAYAIALLEKDDTP